MPCLLYTSVPMILGFIAACLIRNGTMIGLTHDQYFTNLFYGVIMTATSVSVTVATLQELGKLTSKVGTTVVTAAILDDIVAVSYTNIDVYKRQIETTFGKKIT